MDKGIKRRHGITLRFRNFTRCPIPIRIVDIETPAIEFPPSPFLSLLFTFRGPSATLQLRRAFPTEQLETFTPQSEEALIGVRVEGGAHCLYCKLSRRRDLLAGCIFAVSDSVLFPIVEPPLSNPYTSFGG